MNVLRVVLGDQLSQGLSALDDLDAGRDVVLMMEVMEENTYVGHHKQKIVLVLSVPTTGGSVFIRFLTFKNASPSASSPMPRSRPGEFTMRAH